MKRNPYRDEQPGCTVRPAATSRNWRQETSLSLTAEKANIMQIPPALKPGCWGAAGGALALAVFGFTRGGCGSRSPPRLKGKQPTEQASGPALLPSWGDNMRKLKVIGRQYT